MKPSRNIRYNGKKYRIDAQGFLLFPEDWDEDFANIMAEKLHYPAGLTDKHWKVIYFIRNTFNKMNECPLIYVACKMNNLGLGELKELFPQGYLRGACKLAGITYREGKFQVTWLEEHLPYYTREYEGRKYKTDAFGFLLDADDWDENFAVHRAYELRMPDYLTSRHWDIIYFLRDRYHETGSVPTVYVTCEVNRLTLDELENLFPMGYHRGAVNIAGLRVMSMIKI